VLTIFQTHRLTDGQTHEQPKYIIIIIIKNEKILVMLHVKNVRRALNIVIENVTDGRNCGVEHINALSSHENRSVKAVEEQEHLELPQATTLADA